MLSARIEALRLGSVVEIEGVLGPMRDNGDRDFSVRADPHWGDGVYTTGVQALLFDKEGPAKITFKVVRFCEKPNRGLMSVQAVGSDGTSIVPCVAVDGPPVMESVSGVIPRFSRSVSQTPPG